MFSLTKKSQATFDAAYIYPFHEEVDAAFKAHLYSDFMMYEDVIPMKFFAAIKEKSLFENKQLMVEFEQWCRAEIESLQTKSNAIYAIRPLIAQKFDASAREVFQQSFHDGAFLRAEQVGDDFIMLLDLSGGFTLQTITELTFKGAKMEGILEGNYVYDELVEMDDCFAFRILSSYGNPYAESTIYFQDVTARNLYRPAVYVEPGNVSTFVQYIAALNKDDTYFIVQHKELIPIEIDSIQQTEDGIFAGELFLGKNDEAAKGRIYCTTYENPYAHFSEPIPADQLFDAVFSGDVTLTTRAFNTIFQLGGDVAPIVNDILRHAQVGTDDGFYFKVMASHFNELGHLPTDVRNKWIDE